MEHSLSASYGQARPHTEGFSFRRLGLVAGLDLKESLGRPLFLIFALIMLWNGYLMSRGAWIFHSIDTSLGGSKAWADSEFQTAYVYALISFFMISFFVAVAAGLPLIRDGEQKVGDLLHSTPLRPAEYVWGKFLAALAASLAAVLVLPVSTGLLAHLAPDPGSPDIYGPFHLMAYVRPALVFLVPAVVFTAGVSFALGRWTGRPILVFLFPVIVFLLCNSFLWGTYPPRIGEGLSNVLRYLDPSGFRWLKESWLLIDRGIAFYNTKPIAFDTPFLLSRAGLRPPRAPPRGPLPPPLRGPAAPAGPLAKRLETAPAAPALPGRPGRSPSLAMASRPPGFLRRRLAVARFELQELRLPAGARTSSSPSSCSSSASSTRMPGIASRQRPPADAGDGGGAGGGLPDLALGLLFLFYTVESLERERSHGDRPGLPRDARPAPAPSSPARSLANLAVLGVALLGTFAGRAPGRCEEQGKVAFDLRPFLLVWGLLLTPTMIVWITFVAALHSADPEPLHHLRPRDRRRAADRLPASPAGT